MYGPSRATRDELVICSTKALLRALSYGGRRGGIPYVQNAIMGMLEEHRGHVVATEHLIIAAWGAEAWLQPTQPKKAVAVMVCRLRRHGRTIRNYHNRGWCLVEEVQP